MPTTSYCCSIHGEFPPNDKGECPECMENKFKEMCTEDKLLWLFERITGRDYD